MKLRTQVLLAAVGVVIGASALTHSAAAAGSARSDIVGMKQDGTLWVYRNDGNMQAPYSNGASQIGNGWQNFDEIHLADLNGDRRAEAVGVNLAKKSANKTTTSIAVYPHTGNVAVPYTSNTARTYSTNVTPADTQEGVVFGDTLSFDGKTCVGRASLVNIENRQVGNLMQVLQNASYTNNNAVAFNQSYFSVSQNWGQSFKASDYNQYRFGDVTGSGCDDVVARKANGTLWLFEGKKNGVYDTQGRQIGHGWNIFDTILLGDMNADGYADIVARKTDGTLWLYANGGNPASPYSSGAQIGHGWNGFTKLTLGEV